MLIRDFQLDNLPVARRKDNHLLFWRKIGPFSAVDKYGIHLLAIWYAQSQVGRCIVVRRQMDYGRDPVVFDIRMQFKPDCPKPSRSSGNRYRLPLLQPYSRSSLSKPKYTVLRLFIDQHPFREDGNCIFGKACSMGRPVYRPVLNFPPTSMSLVNKCATCPRSTRAGTGEPSRTAIARRPVRKQETRSNACLRAAVRTSSSRWQQGWS